MRIDSLNNSFIHFGQRRRVNTWRSGLGCADYALPPERDSSEEEQPQIISAPTSKTRPKGILFDLNELSGPGTVSKKHLDKIKRIPR